MGDFSEFDGLRAVITGGASGIGAAVARQLSRRGARVVALDLHVDQMPTDITGIRADIGEDRSVTDAMHAAVAHLGGLDIVVNNAAIGAQGTIEGNLDDEWARVLNVNVTGVMRVSRAALPHLRRSTSASIVNTCSIAATAGLPERALYSASKGAVLALTRAMAADHLREGIRVNCVNPGTADTPWVDRLLMDAPDPEFERAALNARQPHGRLVTMDEVAGAILYLASPLSGSTTGTSLPVDGGMQNLRLRPS
ncbi:NAD(P)-dependent dehydrogenase (short-subunit alcohol dehydrogenase family) [Salinibacterium sp. CAN_S4]|uniref:SDR family NAD(P)-dependent oxidoreductase n=1 Tax=Salinibacterium sp. CAN_S4 TaxID=2787727 RepID=UPI0018F05839